MPTGVYKKTKLQFQRMVATRRKQGTYKKGPEHVSWKGEGAGYGAKHDYIKSILGKAKRCKNREENILGFMCSGRSKTFHWANIDNKYTRNAEDYIDLCVSCHGRYDYAKLPETTKLKIAKNRKHTWKNQYATSAKWAR